MIRTTSIRFTLLLFVFVAKLLFHGQFRAGVVICAFGGIAVPLFGLLSSHDDGLYGEPGSEASLDVVLESVQLNVATPLERTKKINEISEMVDKVLSVNRNEPRSLSSFFKVLFGVIISGQKERKNESRISHPAKKKNHFFIDNLFASQ